MQSASLAITVLLAVFDWVRTQVNSVVYVEFSRARLDSQGTGSISEGRECALVFAENAKTRPHVHCAERRTLQSERWVGFLR